MQQMVLHTKCQLESMAQQHEGCMVDLHQGASVSNSTAGNIHSSNKGMLGHLIVHSLWAFGVEATGSNGTDDGISPFHGGR